MLARQGNEFAEMVVFGNVVEDEISADITSNCNTDVD